MGDQLLHLRKVGLLLGVGQDTGPELDDDAGNILEQVRTHDELVAEMRAGCRGWSLARGSALRLFDQLSKFCEERCGVVRAGRGLGVILNTIDRFGFVPHAFDRPVV